MYTSSFTISVTLYCNGNGTTEFKEAVGYALSRVSLADLSLKPKHYFLFEDLQCNLRQIITHACVLSPMRKIGLGTRRRPTMKIANKKVLFDAAFNNGIRNIEVWPRIQILN